MTEALQGLCRTLGHEFRDPRLLQQALTHRSLGAFNNERLEFLGDALLNFVAGDALYAVRPREEEGPLSRLRASLVREESLAEIAKRLKLGELLHLGESELKSGGFRRDSILADALEAILAAVYLDAGFDAAREVTLRLLRPLLENLPDPQTLKDPKTRLQEFLQATARPLPHYEILSESGPPHRREFVVCCRLTDAALSAEGQGSSRRNAEQQAAERMIESVQKNPHHA